MIHVFLYEMYDEALMWGGVKKLGKPRYVIDGCSHDFLKLVYNSGYVLNMSLLTSLRCSERRSTNPIHPTE